MRGDRLKTRYFHIDILRWSFLHLITIRALLHGSGIKTQSLITFVLETLACAGFLKAQMQTRRSMLSRVKAVFKPRKKEISCKEPVQRPIHQESAQESSLTRFIKPEHRGLVMTMPSNASSSDH